MATTDWLLFAELVSEMGRLIQAGQADGPEFQRVVGEADAVLQGAEPVCDDLVDAFAEPHPWSILEGLGGASSAAFDTSR